MKIKIKKIDSRIIIEISCVIFILIFMYLFISQEYLFYNGYKNVDLSYNFNGVSESLCKSGIYINFSDTGSDYNVRNLQYYYINGMNDIKNSYKNSVTNIAIVGISIGVLLGSIIWRKNELKNNKRN